MNEVEIFNETKEEIKEIDDIRKVITYALDHEKLHELEFNIILIDNKTIHEMNKTYRGVDHPTDVISFALEDETNMVLVGNRILGDIYISTDRAKEQAMEYGHSFKRELCFLSIHGLLHLLGYDHIEKEDEAVMLDKQKEILEGYGIFR